MIYFLVSLLFISLLFNGYFLSCLKTWIRETTIEKDIHIIKLENIVLCRNAKIDLLEEDNTTLRNYNKDLEGQVLTLSTK